MSSSSRAALATVVTVSVDVRSLPMAGSLRGVGIRRCQVGERARPGPGRLVDAVADDGPVPRVHEQREDRVHDIVVERPATAGPVSFAAPGGELDLEERTVFR